MSNKNEMRLNKMDTTTATKSVKAIGQTTYVRVQQMAFDIDMSAGEAKILLTAIFEKLDCMLENISALGEVSDTVMNAVNAVNCFVSCAARKVSDIQASNMQVLHVANEMGGNQR